MNQFNHMMCVMKKPANPDPQHTISVAELQRSARGPLDLAMYQDRITRITRNGTADGALVPVDIADLIEAVGGVPQARAILTAAAEGKTKATA